MAIRVEHQTGAAPVAAAGFAGGQGRARAALASSAVASALPRARAEEAARARKHQQREAELARVRQGQLTQESHQLALSRMDHNAQLQQQAADAATGRRMDEFAFEYTTKQRAELERLADAEAQALASTDFTEEEKAEIRRRMAAKRAGIQPVERPRKQTPAEAWAASTYKDPGTGITYAKDNNGNWKPINTPPDRRMSHQDRAKLTDLALKFAVDPNTGTFDQAKFDRFIREYHSLDGGEGGAGNPLAETNPLALDGPSVAAVPPGFNVGPGRSQAAPVVTYNGLPLGPAGFTAPGQPGSGLRGGDYVTGTPGYVSPSVPPPPWIPQPEVAAQPVPDLPAPVEPAPLGSSPSPLVDPRRPAQPWLPQPNAPGGASVAPVGYVPRGARGAPAGARGAPAGDGTLAPAPQRPTGPTADLDEQLMRLRPPEPDRTAMKPGAINDLTTAEHQLAEARREIAELERMGAEGRDKPSLLTPGLAKARNSRGLVRQVADNGRLRAARARANKIQERRTELLRQASLIEGKRIARMARQRSN